MSVMTSQITGVSTVYSTVYSAQIKENIKRSGFPAQKNSDTEDVSTSWRHHAVCFFSISVTSHIFLCCSFRNIKLYGTVQLRRSTLSLNIALHKWWTSVHTDMLLVRNDVSAHGVYQYVVSRKIVMFLWPSRCTISPSCVVPEWPIWKPRVAVTITTPSGAIDDKKVGIIAALHYECLWLVLISFAIYDEGCA